MAGWQAVRQSPQFSLAAFFSMRGRLQVAISWIDTYIEVVALPQGTTIVPRLFEMKANHTLAVF